MNIYTFVNHKTNAEYIVEANSILEADAKYKDKFGVDLAKSSWITCQIEFEVPK